MNETLKQILTSNTQLILGSFLGLFASVIILIITELFNSKRSNQERKFLLKKEIFLEIQKSAKLILNSLDHTSLIVSNLQIYLNSGLFDLTEFNQKEKAGEIRINRQNLFNETMIWFPWLKKDYEILSQKFSEILLKMVDYFKQSSSQPIEIENKKYKPISISNALKEEMNSNIKKFSETLKLFGEKIIVVVENARKDLENN